MAEQLHRLDVKLNDLNVLITEKYGIGYEIETWRFASPTIPNMYMTTPLTPVPLNVFSYETFNNKSVNELFEHTVAVVGPFIAKLSKLDNGS